MKVGDHIRDTNGVQMDDSLAMDTCMHERTEVEAQLMETGWFRTRVPGRDDDEIEWASRSAKKAKKACQKSNKLSLELFVHTNVYHIS